MAIVIPYVKNPTWADGSGGGTAIDAADLNKLEDGVFDAHNMPKVRVTKVAAQAGIVTATVTALTFDTERVDSHAMHDNSTNPTRLTASHAGFYLIGGGARWSANPVTASIYIRLNGSAMIADDTFVADWRTMTIQTGYQLSATWYVELLVQQQSGGNLDISKADAVSPEFWMVRVA